VAELNMRSANVRGQYGLDLARLNIHGAMAL
jgi:hypothetical protein